MPGKPMLTVTLKADKVTKNSIRFQGETEETAYLNVYLPKTLVHANGSPDRIQMVLTPVK